MATRYKASHTFWRGFYALPSAQKESVRRAWEIFKKDPFDPRLRSHQIRALSARAGKTIYSACIEGDLRITFYIEDDTVFTVDIGSHSIYR